MAALTVQAPRIARAAALIAILTIVARLAGFARVVVFSETVGYTDLGSAYQTANSVPNIIFEIVAGGALAALVVPLLAGPLDHGDRDGVGATASALLSWALVLLVPLALLVIVFADPLAHLLDPGKPDVEVAAAGRLLRIFAPQLPLYGIGIVLTGVLQAHRRFAMPVIAPLLSSLTVVVAYVGFGALAPARPDLGHVGTQPLLVLGVGTTLGVVVLSLCLVPAVLRLRLPWRFTLRFDPLLRRRLVGLAWVGVLTVAAQQLAYALTIALANWRTTTGALVLFGQAQAMYLLPWAVLAVPVATSAYPALASASAAGDLDAFRRTLARATRGVLLLSGLGAAALVALAWPAAWVYAHTAGQPSQIPGLARAIGAFAPGLLGYGLFALLSRALYAHRQNRAAAQATLAGWGAVAVLSVVVALAFPAGERVPALAAANSAGMLVLGGVLLVLVAGRCGAGALAGLARAGAVTLLAGTLAALAGVGIRAVLLGSDGRPGSDGWLPVLGAAVLSGALVTVVYAVVAVLGDRPAARALWRRARSEGGV